MCELELDLDLWFYVSVCHTQPATTCSILTIVALTHQLFINIKLV